MANVIYPLFKQHVMSGDIDLTADAIRAVLIDTGAYTYNTAHEAYDDLSGVVGSESTPLANKAVVGANFDSDGISFTAVSGNTVEAIVLFVDSGTPATDYLIAYLDSGTGLPVTPNGGDINVAVNAAGWFDL